MQGGALSATDVWNITKPREVPTYIERLTQISHFAKACEGYFEKTKNIVPVEFREIFTGRDLGFQLIGKSNMIDIRTGKQNGLPDVKLTFFTTNTENCNIFDTESIVPVFYRSTKWPEDLRTGDEFTHGCWTFEKALILLMFSEGLKDQDMLRNVWSEMPEMLKADQNPQDGYYARLSDSVWGSVIEHCSHRIESARSYAARRQQPYSPTVI